MEVCTALRIPNSTPLFTALRVLAVALVFIPDGVPDTTTVCLGFIAEGTVITEPRLTVLPADGAHSVEALPAPGVAQGAVLLLIGRAVGDHLADTSSVSILPTVGG